MNKTVLPRPHQSLDGSAVLFDKFTQVFDEPHLDLLTGFLLERLDGCGIGAALADRDLLRRTVLPDRFLKKRSAAFLARRAVSRKSMVWPPALLISSPRCGIAAISRLRRVKVPSDELSQLERGTRRQIWQGQGSHQEGHRHNVISRDRLQSEKAARLGRLS